MIKINPYAIYIIGGFQDNECSDKTWIVDLSYGFEIKEGPTLNVRRAGHSCGLIQVDSTTTLIIVGMMVSRKITIFGDKPFLAIKLEQNGKISMKKNPDEI